MQYSCNLNGFLVCLSIKDYVFPYPYSSCKVCKMEVSPTHFWIVDYFRTFSDDFIVVLISLFF